MTQETETSAGAAFAGLSPDIDPVRFELFKNAMFFLVNEMALTLVRASYSGILRDNMDFATGIADPAGEMVGEQEDVVITLPQRRHSDHFKCEPVEQVGLEAAFLNQGRQVGVGGSHDSHIDLLRLGAADPLKAAVLHRAENLFLNLDGDQPDLIEQERPAVGCLKASGPAGGRTREGSPLVTKEFRLHQGGCQGSAVERDQGRLPAAGEVVDLGRCQFLARASFADNEHRPVDAGDLRELLDKREKGVGLTKGFPHVVLFTTKRPEDPFCGNLSLLCGRHISASGPLSRCFSTGCETMAGLAPDMLLISSVGLIRCVGPLPKSLERTTGGSPWASSHG